MTIFKLQPYSLHATRRGVRVGFSGTEVTVGGGRLVAVPEDATLPTSYRDANGVLWEYVRESALAFIRVYAKTTAYRGAASPWMYSTPFAPGELIRCEDCENRVKEWIDGFVNAKKKLGEGAFSTYAIDGGAGDVDAFGVPPVPTNGPPAGLTSETKTPDSKTSETKAPGQITTSTSAVHRGYAGMIAFGAALALAIGVVYYFHKSAMP